MEGTLTAKLLKDQLSGSYEERMNEEKTILITMIAGAKPTVEFTGFWNGMLIRKAMDSVAKAYRIRRCKNTHPARGENKKEESDEVQASK